MYEAFLDNKTRHSKKVSPILIAIQYVAVYVARAKTG